MNRTALHTLVLICLVSAGCGGDDDTMTPMDSGSAEVDAGTPSDAGAGGDAADRCTTPGEMRTGECGNCGAQFQRCTADGAWEPVEACSSEGPCMPGAFERELTDRCGQRTRDCNDTCQWSAWVMSTPDGECAPDDTRPGSTMCGVSEISEETCSPGCAWQPATCVDACGGMRRTTPADAEEICIPGGSFVRGDTRFPDALPVADVMVSEFYIERYPVTNERYLACMAAGACTRPANGFTQMLYMPPARARMPVQGVNWDQARAFCMWDGGRRLPTEAEWEKAARGPTPRSQPHTWDGSGFQCSLLWAEGCGSAMPYAPTDRIIDEIDSLPGTASYYGVEMLIGGGWDWTNDIYDAMYYADPMSLVDPQGPAAGRPSHVIRGGPRHGTRGDWFHVSRRRQQLTSDEFTTIRCARSP